MHLIRRIAIIKCFAGQAFIPVKAAAFSVITMPQDSIVYNTRQLVVRQLSGHIYEHTSFMNSHDFGRVDCNGMIVINGNEAVVFDTPADDSSSAELIRFLQQRKCRIKAVIPTHFHEDCVGGLATFSKYHIAIFASVRTIALLKRKGTHPVTEIHAFDNYFDLMVGNSSVYATYFGEGHTNDNIVGYYPLDHAVFGGCLVKTIGATKGNLEDANVMAWAHTVRSLKNKYPAAQIVIPGHGQWGGTELFDYTIKLFE